MLVARAMILGSLCASSVPRHAGAQEATPAVTVPTSWTIPGIEVIASVPDLSLATGMVLEFDRIISSPRFEVPMHYHPAIDILYVASGSVEEGTTQVVRAAVDGTPVPVEMLDPVLYDPSQDWTVFPAGVTPVAQG